VLRYPEPDGDRPVDLAQRADMTKQAMNYLLVELERLGYIRRRAGPDSTRRLVYLTARGRRACDVIRATMSEVARSWAAQNGPERYAIFLEVLRSLAGSAPAG
jgi:DNA-binding MarR family transcriptional regulator